MDGGELQMVREYLGLTVESLAGMLRVNPRSIRSWEAGRDPIPERLRLEVEAIEEWTAGAVGELVDALRDTADDVSVVVYRRDEDMHAARPDTAHLPARWWRHVVARACEEVPGVTITSSSGDVFARCRGCDAERLIGGEALERLAHSPKCKCGTAAWENACTGELIQFAGSSGRGHYVT